MMYFEMFPVYSHVCLYISVYLSVLMWNKVDESKI